MFIHAASRHTKWASQQETCLPRLDPIFNQLYTQQDADPAIQKTPTTHSLYNSRQLMYSSSPQFRYSTEAAGQTLTPSSSNLDFSFDTSFPAEWGMQYQETSSNSVGGGLVNQGAFKTNNNGHSRNYSESTVNSAGPSSPFTSSFSNPFIANTEHSPRAQSQFEDSSSSLAQKQSSRQQQQQQQQQTFNHFSNVGYIPSQLSHTPAVHLDMAHMAMDQHNAPADDMPDFSHSARQSVSSRGQDSPSTPQMEKATLDDESTGTGQEERPPLYKINTADYRQTAPRVELFRTESAAAADELYNPDLSNPNPAKLQPKQTSSTYLSPSRNLVQDRLRTANSARSQSPHQPTSRAKSPFRPGSPLAPPSEDNFKSPSAFFTSAADARRQQIEEASAKEMNRHNPPTLQREATKTMSPRDALLDYDMDPNGELPLFPDAIPMGYQKHVGPSDFYTSNFINSANQPYTNYTTQPQQTPNLGAFRPQDSVASSQPNFSFVPQLQQQQPQPQQQAPQQQSRQHQQQQQQQPAQASSNPYSAPQYRQANLFPEKTPDFPAHLTSMESSVSDAPISSQGSAISEAANNIIQRPQDTSAATGGYTCTFHNCVQRFDTPAKLQKHKREAHRVQRDISTSLSSAPPTTAAGSVNTSVSPDPSHGEAEDDSSDRSGSVASVGSGMTSAALAARNSQAGPHKCTRINPSTGKPCNTIFSRPYDLTRHEDTIHNRQKVKVRCEYCREEKTFSRNDALTRHMRVVHPDVPWEVKRGRRSDY